MTTIRRIAVSQLDGNGADDAAIGEIRPAHETAFYLDNNDKLTLMMFNGERTHRKSKVLAPGVLWGSNADSGDGANYDTIKLIPDAELFADGNHQYIIIDPTGPNHVHIRAGGTIDDSGSELIIGGETSHVKIGSGLNPPVYIRSNDNQWTFGTDGVLTLPSGGDIVNSSGTSVLSGGGGAVVASDRLTSSTYSVILEGTTGTVTIPGPIIGSGNISFAADQNSFDIGRRLRLRDGDISSHIHLDSPDNSTYDLIWGDDYKFVKVDHTGTVVIGTNDGTQRLWTFETDGTLTFPSGLVKMGYIAGADAILASNEPFGVITEGTGATVLQWMDSLVSPTALSSIIINDTNYASAGDITVRVGAIGSQNTWTFKTSGELIFPDGSEQTTAYTGTNNAATIDITNTNGLTTVYYPTFVENRDGEEILRADVNLTYRTDDNILGVGSIGFSGGNFRVVSVPTLSTGASGDREGDMAFNSSYIYYCFADFGTAPTETFTVINVGENNNLMRVDMATNPNYTVPTAGWYVTIGGVLMTLSAFSAPSGSEYHFLFDNAAGGGGFPSTVTLTSPTGYTNIWKRLSWSGDTW